MADTDGLTCHEVVELVSDYLEDMLPPATRARFDAHLAACPPCLDYLEQMRRTRALLGMLRTTTAPPVPDALLTAFRAWKGGASDRPEVGRDAPGGRAR